MPPVSAIQKLGKPGVVAHACMANSWEAEQLQSEFPSQNKWTSKTNVQNEAKDSYNLFPFMLKQTA